MSWAYMFLDLRLEGGGPLKGEARAKGYEGQIEISRFDFDIDARDAWKASSAKAGHVRIEQGPLKITKRFDSASAALLQAAREGRLVQQARISVVARGDAATRVFALTVESGFIAAIDLDVSTSGGGGSLVETVNLTYRKLRLTYAPDAKELGKGARSVSSQSWDFGLRDIAGEFKK